MSRNTYKTRCTPEKRDWQEFRQIICAAAQMLIDAISGFVADFLPLIVVTAGGFRLKGGPGNFTLNSFCTDLRVLHEVSLLEK